MEDKKTYSVLGTVSIGTDEYRDLIEEKNEAVNDASNYRQRMWDAEKKASDAEKRITELEKQNNLYKEFVNHSELVIDDYKKFIYEKMTKEHTNGQN